MQHNVRVSFITIGRFELILKHKQFLFNFTKQHGELEDLYLF